MRNYHPCGSESKKLYSLKYVILFLVCGLAACASEKISVSITNPSNGDTYFFGEKIIFSGNATIVDNSTGSSLELLWTSSIDGSIGSGARVTTDTLSEGTHLITLAATDSDNNTGADSISITVLPRTGLYSRGSDYWYRDYTDTIWASVTLRKESRDYVTGLDYDDFQITESIVAKADGSVKAQSSIDMTGFIDDEYGYRGFWEASTGGKPVDLVIVYDCTGTMTDYLPDVRTELTSMVARMVENHIDFRFSVVSFSEVEVYHGYRFYGPQEPDLISDAIDGIGGGSEGWDPTQAYDAVLFTPWLGFREEARKVCVVITDIVPQTAYVSRTQSSATRSAMELFLEETGVELYYCQRDWEATDLAAFHVNEDINPWASDSQSGFEALTDTGGQPLSTKIEWPFSSVELEKALGIDAVQTVTDSRYLFGFESSFDRWEALENAALNYYPDDYELHVTFSVEDPDNPGEQLSVTCSYPIEKQLYDIEIQLTDEEGTPYGTELSCDLYHKMDGRQLSSKWQLSPQDGVLSVIRLLPATYNVFIRNSGSPKYRYETVRAIHRETIEVTADAISFDMQVATADKAELYKVRGLLQDIANWQGIGDPFQDVVDEASAWLDDIESDGVSWQDMAAIKRFMVGMSGYANIIRFSQAEADGAIKDFDTIVENFRDIVDQVDKIQSNTADDWDDALLSGLMTIIDVLITHGEFTAAKKAIEEGLENLVAYIAVELTQDLRQKIIEQFPDGDYSELLKSMINYLIDSAFGNETTEPDWDAVLSAVQAIALDQAMDAVWDEAKDQVLDNFIDTAIQVSIIDDAFTKTVKKLIKDILEAFMSDDVEHGFDDALEEFARGVGEYVTTIDNATIVATVNDIFDNAAATMQAEGVPVDVREFLVGMARELTLLAVPAVVNGQANYAINTDAVVSVLVKYGVYYVILKDYFIDELQDGLAQTLEDARHFVPVGDVDDWQLDMMFDFRDYNSYVYNVQDNAWDAIRLQEAITEWAEQMQSLCELLFIISEPLDMIAKLYPDLKNTAENVHMLIAVLDSFQILANAISFGLKVDCLDTFGSQALPMAEAVFPVQ